jgi:hypothetical protein
MTDEHLAALADSTGVPASAWALLSPGWASIDDLRRLRAGGAGWKEKPVDGAWAFPERSGDGRVVGLSFRALDGRKGAPTGAKRGLIVPIDLHQRSDPVLAVEGASDVATACAAGLTAVGRPSNRAGGDDLAMMLDGRDVIVIGERDAKAGGAWPGRDGAKAVARQLASHWSEPVAWTLPPPGLKDIREHLRAKLAERLNPNDADEMRAAGGELLASLRNGAKYAKVERRTQADGLVDLALQSYRLGISTQSDTFAVPVDGPAVAMMFRAGGGLRTQLAKQYRKATGKTPSSSALTDALVALEGMAQDAEPEPLGLRLAAHDHGVVLDIGDPSGRAVVVTPMGWTIEPVSPVLFRRTSLTLSLPEPEQASPEKLADLKDVLNVDEEAWPLVMGWLVAALLPDVPHPVLLLGGEQGTAKSTAERLLAGLVDPSAAPTRGQPRDIEQWAIAAAGSWIVPLDNLSRIPEWLSDAICRAVTGEGYIRRKLYTDSDVSVLSFRRCVIITSIDPGALRGDLGERLLPVDLHQINDEKRRTEADLDLAYQKMRPRVLGGLLSALSGTLGQLANAKLPTKPRLADFALVLAALDASCPKLTGGKALDLYVGQRERIAEDVIESDAVASAIVRLTKPWEGTAAELLKALTPTPPEPRPEGWPKSPRGMSGMLRRTIPALRAIGIIVTDLPRTGTARRLKIVGTQDGPSLPSPSSSAAAGAPESGVNGDGPVTVDDGRAAEPSLDFPPEIRGGDGCDGSDGRFPDISMGDDRQWGRV